MSDRPVRRYQFVEFGADTPDQPVAYVDADDYDRLVADAEWHAAAARTFRAALARIADQESGVWGQWASDALNAHPDYGAEA